ncbi:MAG: S8 family serine peptidase, partial [Deltaproteobacteria bacterium]|nr:S8 family serine peptidase [Deltaproteobacteria bacterium]
FMKFQKIIIIVILFLFSGSNGFSKEIKKYLIKFKPNILFSQAVVNLENSGFKLEKYLKEIDVYIVNLENSKLLKSNAAFLKENTLYIEKDSILKAFLAPNDTYYVDQKEIQRIQIEQAWDLSLGSKDVVLAVVDTGYTFNHIDLKDQVWTNPKPDTEGDYINDIHGWDFVGNDNDPTDENNPGHGTHVSGIIGALGNNAAGIAGINFQTSIMPLRFLDKNGEGYNSNAVKAIIYAANHGARLINASWGGGSADQSLLDAILYAYDKGTLLIAAAGNEVNNNDKSPMYPASYDTFGVLTVASSEGEGTLSSFSNFGLLSVDLVAPGSNILSTVPPNDWKRLSGTSMAAPHITGIGGLILSLSPSLSVKDLRNAILNSVYERSKYQNNISTHGDVSAYLALNQLGAGFQVWPARITIKKGSTYPFTAYQASGVVQWSVSPATLASISTDGVLNAQSDGDVTVIAKDATGNIASTISVGIRTQESNGGGGGCSKNNNKPDPSLPNQAGAALSFTLPFFVGFLLRRRRTR